MPLFDAVLTRKKPQIAGYWKNTKRLQRGMFQCKKESLKMGFRASGIRRIEKSLKTGKILSPDMEKKKDKV